MSLSDLSHPQAVLRALAEFDEIGREAFLAKYGFGPARTYFLVHEGRFTTPKPSLVLRMAINSRAKAR
jgi:hypothetical protein